MLENVQCVYSLSVDDAITGTTSSEKQAWTVTVMVGKKPQNQTLSWECKIANMGDGKVCMWCFTKEADIEETFYD